MFKTAITALLALASAASFATTSYDDLKVGDVVKGAIEVPGVFSSSYVPLPPGDWVLQASEHSTTLDALLKKIEFVVLRSADANSKTPLLAISFSRRTANWDFRGCTPVDPSKHIVYSSSADPSTPANEGRCAYIKDYGTVSRTNLDNLVKTSANVYNFLWRAANASPELVIGKPTQMLLFSAQPWGGYEIMMAFLVNTSGAGVSPMVDWVRANFDALVEAAKGKKVDLTETHF